MGARESTISGLICQLFNDVRSGTIQSTPIKRGCAIPRNGLVDAELFSIKTQNSRLGPRSDKAPFGSCHKGLLLQTNVGEIGVEKE